MKTERLVVLTTPTFKRKIEIRARRAGVSVGEFVRARCDAPESDTGMAELREAAQELRTRVDRASAALASGLRDAEEVLAELASQRKDRVVGAKQ